MKIKQGCFILFFYSLLLSCSDNHTATMTENAAPPGLVAPVMVNSLWGFIDEQGTMILAAAYKTEHNDFPYFQKGLAIVTSAQNNKKGVINNKGSWVIQPAYSAIWSIAGGIFQCRADTGGAISFHYFNTAGKRISVPETYNVGIFSEGLAPVKIAEKYGYVDTAFKLVIPAVFYDAGAFSEGLAAVDTNAGCDAFGDRISKCGFIDHTGKWVLPESWDHAFEFKNNRCIVTKEDKQGVIDRNGKVVVPFSFIFVSSNNGFRYGLAFANDYDAYQKGNMFKGIINLTGNWVVPPTYEELNDFSEGLAAVKLSDKWGFIDTLGKVCIPVKFEEVSDFKNGIAIAKLDGKFGYINTHGVWVIANQYEDLKLFVNDLAPAKENEKYGYINRKGEWKIAPAFSAAGYFHNTADPNDDLPAN